MIQVAVCDDERAAITKIGSKTESVLDNMKQKFYINEFNSADDLLQSVKKRYFDLIELDIELGKSINGIELAKKINQISPSTKIIFITSYKKYYMDVYDANHVFFVEKSKIDQVLEKAIQKALLRTNEESTDESVSIKYKGETTVVKKQNILYVEKRLRIAEFHLKNTNSIAVYMNIFYLMNILGNKDFVQIHRSFVVNMRYVTKLSGDSLILSDGRILPIGKSYMKEFRHRFMSSHNNIRKEDN